MSEKRIVFVTPEGLESNFRLLSYFQLRNREENYVIFKEASESLILCFGRLLGEDGELRIIKPTKEETEEILSIINEPKVIKFIINDDKLLSTLYIINYESTEVNTSTYDKLTESDLFKGKKYASLKLGGIMQKKAELKSELSNLKKEQIAAKWREVKNESRTITDDGLLELVEKELNALEKDDFVEECTERYRFTFKWNIITLLIAFGIFLIASFSNNVLEFFKSSTSSEGLLELIKLYTKYAIVLLVIQFVTYVFFRKYRLLGRVFTLFGLVFYIFKSLQLILGNPISLGWIIILVIICVNSFIGIHTYLKLRIKQPTIL